jgi:sulfite reductase alpha subunit-like flavoprotein
MRGRLLILFGSQTGCAEEVAYALAADAARRCFSPQCMSLEDYDMRNLPSERLAIYVVSTTGEGEVPDGMRLFWQFLLRKDLPSNSLCGSLHACFGLGDSSYPKFNFAAKRLHRRLLQLGSQELVPVGLGDDQDAMGQDQALLPWLESLWGAVEEHAPTPVGCAIRPASECPAARYHVSLMESLASSRHDYAHDDAAVPASKTSKQHPFRATVVANTRLTSQGCGRDVRHIALDISGWKSSYTPGDALAVQPHNPIARTRALLDSLGIEPEAALLITPAQVFAPKLPRSTWTAIELFTKRLDVYGVPRRVFFALLAHFATEPMHKERLTEFGSPEGAADLLEYAARPRRTYAEVLLDFPSARPPLAYYLDLIPPLRERYFSISSSPLRYPSEVHLTVAVVQYQSRLQVPRFGVCSTYLAQLRPKWVTDGAVCGNSPSADTVDVWLRRGCLTMPADPRAPLVMVGPGTGVAPFRAFVQTRQVQRCELDGRAVEAPIGATCLYFGCRHPEEDYLYADEWQAHLAAGDLSAFHVAFSRMGAQKVYVQHKMKAPANAAELWQLLAHPAAHVYIAGAANQMPKDIRSAICAVAQSHGGMSDIEASGFVEALERSKRFQCETW